MTTKTTKAAWTVAKILEIICFVDVILYLAALIWFATGSVSANTFIESVASANHGELRVNGFVIQALIDDVTKGKAGVGFALAGLLSFACYAMIFRNVYLIFKTAAGKTKFAQGETPFQKDISRMIREIGIFFIAIPVIEFILSGIFRLAIGIEIAEITVQWLQGFIAGLIMIALSQVFTYGEKLESDVEGLV